MAIQQRNIPGTELSVSLLGFGNFTFGVNWWGDFTDEQAVEIQNHAFDRGVTFFDTAPAYGASEERLGALIEGERDDWVLCTKAGEEFDITTGESSYRFDPEWVGQSVRRSLERLRTDPQRDDRLRRACAQTPSPSTMRLA